MKTKKIKISEKEYSFLFGMEALSNFCEQFEISISEIAELTENIGFHHIAQIGVFAINQGMRVDGHTERIAKIEVLDAIEKDFTLLEKITDYFSESLTTILPGEEPNKKQVAKK